MSDALNAASGISSTESSSRRFVQALLFLVLVGAAAWHFTMLRFTFNVEFQSQAPLERLFDFEADRPFQYRILLPALARLVPLENVSLRFMALEWVFSVLSVLAFRSFLRRFFEGQLFCSLLSLLLLPVMSFNFVLPRVTPLWFPWDVPAVFFMAAGLVLLYDRRWGAFYVLFALATLNRQTSCFLTMIWFFANWNTRHTREFWIHLCAQTGLWLVIKLWLFEQFSHRSGQFLYSHIQENLDYLISPAVWPLMLSSLGFTWLIAAVGFPLIRDDFIRRGLLALIPIGIGLFLVGRVVETRIYGELAPLTLTAVLLIGATLPEREKATATP